MIKKKTSHLISPISSPRNCPFISKSKLFTSHISGNQSEKNMKESKSLTKKSKKIHIDSFITSDSTSKKLDLVVIILIFEICQLQQVEKN